DLHPREVHAEVAGEVQDQLELLQVLLGVEPRVAFGAGGLEQALTLVEAQGLGMDAVALRDHADHVVLALPRRGPALGRRLAARPSAARHDETFGRAGRPALSDRRGSAVLRPGVARPIHTSV